jgi:2-polyprenyl-3-methyl-5-hydroxy-6-metoxy-1,4-benzoquinol methylase
MKAQAYDEEYFERMAGGWNAVSFPIIASLVRPLLEENAPQDVLDFGCGSGTYADTLKATGARADGCDTSAAAVRRAGGKYHRAFCIGGSSELAAERYDFIFSTEVLEHINNHREALADLHRSLRPGGVLFLTTTAYGPSIFTMLYAAKSGGLTPLKIFSRCADWFRGYFSESRRDSFIRAWCFEPLGGHLHGFVRSKLLDDVRRAGFSIEKHGDFYPFEPLQLPFLYSHTIRGVTREKEWSAAKKSFAVLLHLLAAPLNRLLRMTGLLANNLFLVARKHDEDRHPDR